MFNQPLRSGPVSHDIRELSQPKIERLIPPTGVSVDRIPLHQSISVMAAFSLKPLACSPRSKTTSYAYLSSSSWSSYSHLIAFGEDSAEAMDAAPAVSWRINCALVQMKRILLLGGRVFSRNVAFLIQPFLKTLGTFKTKGSFIEKAMTISMYFKINPHKAWPSTISSHCSSLESGASFSVSWQTKESVIMQVMVLHYCYFCNVFLF